LSELELERTVEAGATMAYTRYVLDRGLAGDIFDLYVVLSPCVVGYAAIGRDLLASRQTKAEDNPYMSWIEMYAGEDHQDAARAHVKLLDELAQSRVGPDRLESLVRSFRQATSLEMRFWDMALDLRI